MRDESDLLTSHFSKIRESHGLPFIFQDSMTAQKSRRMLRADGMAALVSAAAAASSSS
jgi:hypothetical protein